MSYVRSMNFVRVAALMLFLAGCGAEDAGPPPASPSGERPPSPSASAESEPAPAEEAAPTPALTREAAAEAVEAQRRRAAEALERGDEDAEAAARIALVEAYVRWAADAPSTDECLPPRPAEEEAEPGQRVIRTHAIHARRGARRDLRRELDCAEERGGDAARIGALRAELESLGERAAAHCRAEGMRPMEGNFALLGTMGGGGVCPSPEDPVGARGRQLDRALGIERAPAGSWGAPGDLFRDAPGVDVLGGDEAAD